MEAFVGAQVRGLGTAISRKSVACAAAPSFSSRPGVSSLRAQKVEIDAAIAAAKASQKK
eukprot:CAMPEP_0185831696 /NCGR_PEP_ID=MMETSP1353-20130828/1657_1 /TAXON_ID=1077150 /ORGANISM="Erythrolobus australicus, Strain CCMP3124" /LENGTH=58 /DNA_ID=CAMNT_0028529799 /DNA_START=74 /DNA_END=247 /DNA_ORIENTATION=+